MRTVREQDVFRACAILFGDDVSLSREFLAYIQPSGVKTAYRKIARETHPDFHHDKDDATRRRHSELFIKTQWAYEQLREFLKLRDRGGATLTGSTRRARAKPPSNARRTHHARADARPCSHYKGKLPKRRLLFGQYLFFSGAVPWEALIHAIVWQRRQRPRLGDIAVRLELLSPEEISGAVRGRRPGEPLGEAAVRLGFLKSHELQMLLMAQRMEQKKFGLYFIESGWLSAFEMDRLYRAFISHNLKHPRYSWEHCCV